MRWSTQTAVAPLCPEALPLVPPVFVWRQTRHLVGRDQEISDLKKAVLEARTAVVWGGPGEGKSTVAAEVALQLHESGQLPRGVFSLDALRECQH